MTTRKRAFLGGPLRWFQEDGEYGEVNEYFARFYQTINHIRTRKSRCINAQYTFRPTSDCSTVIEGGAASYHADTHFVKRIRGIYGESVGI